MYGQKNPIKSMTRYKRKTKSLLSPSCPFSRSKQLSVSESQAEMVIVTPKSLMDSSNVTPETMRPKARKTM